MLNLNTPIIVPGIYDSLSAILVKEQGFEFGWVSGFSVATSFGLQDNNSIGINGYTQRISEIAKFANLKLIVDCDEGYGEMENTIELVRKLIDNNVVAICLEDNVFPKTNSFKNITRPIQDKAVLANKISTLKSKFPQLKIIARTESLICNMGIEDAYERSCLYENSGADYILIHSKFTSFDEYETLIMNYPGKKNLVVIPSLGKSVMIHDLMEANYKIIIIANQILRTSIYSTNKMLNELKSDKKIPLENFHDKMVSMDYIFELINKYDKQ